jgi:hypothetical protein
MLDLITVKYDSFYISRNGSVLPEEELLKYADISNGYIQFQVDPNTMQIVKVDKPVVDVQEQKVEYINDYLDLFASYAKSRQFKEASDILKRLFIRISPYDYSALHECYCDFQELFGRHPTPEFDTIIEAIKQHNLNVVYQSVLR